MEAVIEAFAECSRRLRSAIAEAAIEAEPEQLTRLVGWLQQIQLILRQTDLAAGTGTPGDGVAEAALTTSSTAGKGSSRKAKGATAYPRFFKDGDSLVKVGWSKKEGNEYEHKAPKSAITALAAALNQAGQRKRRFTVDQLLPVRNPTSGEDVPDYQIYLALAWLRDCVKLVDQHGRQGYTLKPGSLAEQIETHWNSLALRS